MDEPKRPTCETCPYWKSLRKPGAAKTLVSGVCFKRHPREYAGDTHAPRLANGEHRRSDPVRHDDFCGEHPDFPAYIAARKAQPPAG